MTQNADVDKNKFTGCLLGLACGDYLGLPFEYVNSEKTKKLFEQGYKLDPFNKINTARGKLPVGYYSDDTAQMICLAESLICKKFNTEDQLRRYREWLFNGYATPINGDKAIGVGQHTFKVLLNKKRTIPTEINNNDREGGNGALMRCAPIGLMYFDSKELLLKNSLLSALVTHNNEIAAFCCVVLAFFISYSIKNYEKKDFCRFLLNDNPDLPTAIINLLTQDFHETNLQHIETTGYALYTLDIALHSFFTTDTFEDCLIASIGIGGDTDTQGAVAGALAGAFYREEAIPANWKASLLRNQYISEIACLIHYKAT